MLDHTTVRCRLVGGEEGALHTRLFGQVSSVHESVDLAWLLDGHRSAEVVFAVAVNLSLGRLVKSYAKLIDYFADLAKFLVLLFPFPDLEARIQVHWFASNLGWYLFRGRFIVHNIPMLSN